MIMLVAWTHCRSPALKSIRSFFMAIFRVLMSLCVNRHYDWNNVVILFKHVVLINHYVLMRLSIVDRWLLVVQHADFFIRILQSSIWRLIALYWLLFLKLRAAILIHGVIFNKINSWPCNLLIYDSLLGGRSERLPERFDCLLCMVMIEFPLSFP